MRTTESFVLRKYRGTFDACRLHGAGAAIRATSNGVLGLVGAIALVCLIVVVALAAFFHSPVHALHVASVHGPAALAGLAIGQTAPAEVKKVVEDLKTDWEKFKEQNDQAIAEQKKLGAATAETKQVVDRINSRLDEIELKFERSRVATGLGRINGEMLEQKEKRSVEQKAFTKWARRGPNRLSDEEVKSLTSLKFYDPDEAEFKALDTDSDIEGGAFVPHQLTNRVIQKLILVSRFRDIAAVENISTGALEIPAEGTQNFSAGWVGERAARPQTNAAQVRMERIPVHEMYAEPPVSQTQLDDSVFDVETWLSDRVSTALAQIEGQGFLNGNGVTSPEGVMTNPNITGVVSGSAADLTADQLITAWATLPTFYANDATWILNRATLGRIRKFKDNNNQYLWAPGGFGVGLQGSFPATILGQPYVEMPDMPNIAANAYPIAFGNFRKGYQVVDRLGMRVIRDNLTAKPFILFYTTKRVGGQVVLAEAIVKLQCHT